LLVETARLWRSLGFLNANGQFRIDGVTGPDEYSALADNNVYTNLLAQHNLRSAAEAAKRHPKVARALGVHADEITSWSDAAEKMLIPYDYLGEAAFMDLNDLEHNTRDGLHIASLAGAWSALVVGFGGVRPREGSLVH
jgi:trehalose/maltose hydrolase-like predicted phosphorylase